MRDVALSPPTPPEAKPASLFSPHFIIGSLFLTLTLGATTGMVNLLRIAAGGDVPIDHRQIHGHTQVLGFAVLFLMGIAYHALPRILGVGGASPAGPVRASFWLMFTGVLLRNAGSTLRAATRRAGSCRCSRVCLELAAAALFVRFVFALLAKVREGKYDRRDPLLRFVRAGHPLLSRGHAARRGAGYLARRDTWTPCCPPRSTSRSTSRPSTASCSPGSTDSATGSCRFSRRRTGPARHGPAALWLAGRRRRSLLASWLPGLPNCGRPLSAGRRASSLVGAFGRGLSRRQRVPLAPQRPSR